METNTAQTAADDADQRTVLDPTGEWVEVVAEALDEVEQCVAQFYAALEGRPEVLDFHEMIATAWLSHVEDSRTHP